MSLETGDIPDDIKIPQGKCYINLGNTNSGTLEGEQTGVKGLFSIKTVLFGGDFSGETHEGYIPYLASKIQGFEENIRSHPVRFQGLINCLTKSLIPYGQNKSDLQLQENFEAFKQNLEFLYGYLGDMPELLEQNKKGSIKPQNISITKLLKKGKGLTAEKRSITKGQEYTTALLAIISEELPDGAVKYIRKKYRVKKSPKATELIGLGISEEVATRIESEGTFHKIQAILSQEETIIGEDGEYKIYEMFSIAHLEEESRVTDHCVGESDHYIRKMNNQTIRMFSLRYGRERVTLEYNIKRNCFVQMKGNGDRSITLTELGVILSIISDTNLQQVGFNHEDVIELQSKENFVCGYHKFDTSLSVKDYIGIHSIEDCNVSGGKVICTEDTTTDEIEALSKLPVDLDITHTTAAVKNSIQNVKGSLIDHSSEAIQMNSLESVGGYFNCESANTINVDSLESVGKSFNCKNAETISTNSLQSIGGAFDCETAKIISLDSLQFIEGSFYCRSAETISMNSLKSIGGYFNCGNTKIISLDSLESIWGSFNCWGAETISLDSLQSVGVSFDCRSAKTVSLDSLQSIGGYFNCRSAESIDVNSLKSVGGHFDCRSAETGNLLNLKKCKKIIMKQENTIQLPEGHNFDITYM